MKQARAASIRSKIARVTVTSSALGLLLACSAFLVLDRAAGHRNILRDLSTLAAIVSYEVAAALVFEDHTAATEILSSLEAEPQISYAAVYDRKGGLIAQYRAEEQAGRSDWALEHAPARWIEGGHAHVMRGIELDGERIGTFVAQASLQHVHRQLYTKAAVVLLVLMVCCGIVITLGARLIRSVTNPILELAALSRHVTASQDYTSRALVQDQDEIGVLAQNLNAMLERIENDKDLYAQREELRAINAELERERERAIGAVRTKTAFLANMSHEIRTPMTAILGYVDLVRRAEVTGDEAMRMLDIVQRNGQHLISVINDILDISKLESGQLQVESILCSPVEVIEDAVVLMRERASEKGLQLELDYVCAVPKQIRSDPTRLRQVLINLLSNAIKFTLRGYVRMRVETEIPAERAPQLVISVRDTGMGVPPDKHEAIFNAFAQGDTSTTRRFGGTGLGLSISMMLARLLGGDLELSWSRPGEGSCFTLRIPVGMRAEELELIEPQRESAAARARADQVRALPQNLSGRILLAEDSVDNQRLVRMMLRRAGLEVDLVENGRAACERVRAASLAGDAYDVVLMDMQMPEMDGYEATQALRSEGYAGPIVAFTAHAMAGERERCITAGCDDFVTKPIDRAALLRTLEQHLLRRRSSES